METHRVFTWKGPLRESLATGGQKKVPSEVTCLETIRFFPAMSSDALPEVHLSNLLRARPEERTIYSAVPSAAVASRKWTAPSVRDLVEEGDKSAANGTPPPVILVRFPGVIVGDYSMTVRSPPAFIADVLYMPMTFIRRMVHKDLGPLLEFVVQELQPNQKLRPRMHVVTREATYEEYHLRKINLFVSDVIDGVPRSWFPAEPSTVTPAEPSAVTPAEPSAVTPVHLSNLYRLPPTKRYLYGTITKKPSDVFVRAPSSAALAELADRAKTEGTPPPRVMARFDGGTVAATHAAYPPVYMPHDLYMVMQYVGATEEPEWGRILAFDVYHTDPVTKVRTPKHRVVTREGTYEEYRLQAIPKLYDGTGL